MILQFLHDDDVFDDNGENVKACDVYWFECASEVSIAMAYANRLPFDGEHVADNNFDVDFDFDVDVMLSLLLLFLSFIVDCRILLYYYKFDVTVIIIVLKIEKKATFLISTKLNEETQQLINTHTHPISKTKAVIQVWITLTLLFELAVTFTHIDGSFKNQQCDYINLVAMINK